ncbi:terpenoid synthase [Cryphonectria parasitica EP155]|uniref:Terpene synthase n=1 Tax=Cryphonectria parasitica (strain ATCC 38755 / EP155) TaxID=660469 RepID=A0A9P4XZP4_CRYP1|nr:terpenoid synthase [Cryphonectria parasitica EP155]KAF3763838.1 terpenoid synthase [Cryphonectria parasitica EP155]
MDAFHHPEKPRPTGESIGGEVARQFWVRVCSMSTPTFRSRFLKNIQDYLHGTAEQAEDRDKSHIRDLPSYLELRRKTIGVLSSFDMLEMDKSIPDLVLEDPAFQELLDLAVDLTIIANDVLSFDKEQAVGDDQHNLVTIVMAEQGMDVQSAVNWAGRLHSTMTDRFNELFSQLSRCGGLFDEEVKSYMKGVGQWVGGNVQWSFEGERYFGKRGLEVMKTRSLCLTPKLGQPGLEIGPVIVDDVSMKQVIVSSITES